MGIKAGDILLFKGKGGESCCSRDFDHVALVYHGASLVSAKSSAGKGYFHLVRRPQHLIGVRQAYGPAGSVPPPLPPARSLAEPGAIAGLT